MTDRSFIEPTDGGVLLHVKVVPGASRDRIAGPLGDRLKIQVTAPPEGGKANKAVCVLLAKVLGVAPRDVTMAAGHGQAVKTVKIAGVTTTAITSALTDSR